MGREEIAALVDILQSRMASADRSQVIGVRHIHFDEPRQAFIFDKCETEGYCQERPAVIAIDGTTLDPGGPLFEEV